MKGKKTDRQNDSLTERRKWEGQTDRMTERQAEGPTDTDKQSIAKHAISFNWGIINALVPE